MIGAGGVATRTKREKQALGGGCTGKGWRSYPRGNGGTRVLLSRQSQTRGVARQHARAVGRNHRGEGGQNAGHEKECKAGSSVGLVAG